MEAKKAIECIEDVLSSDYNYDETLGYQLTSYDAVINIAQTAEQRCDE